MPKNKRCAYRQRLLSTNTSDAALDRVVFYAPANMLRRESALMYDAEHIEAAFAYGYAPGGIELLSVRADGEAADYGFQCEDEIYLRAACDIPAGESRAIEFEYYLLFTENNAFLGCGALDVRLSDFCFIPARLDAENHDFALHTPLPFTRYIDAPQMDVMRRDRAAGHIYTGGHGRGAGRGFRCAYAAVAHQWRKCA